MDAGAAKVTAPESPNMPSSENPKVRVATFGPASKASLRAMSSSNEGALALKAVRPDPSAPDAGPRNANDWADGDWTGVGRDDIGGREVTLVISSAS